MKIILITAFKSFIDLGSALSAIISFPYHHKSFDTSDIDFVQNSEKTDSILVIDYSWMNLVMHPSASDSRVHPS